MTANSNSYVLSSRQLDAFFLQQLHPDIAVNNTGYGANVIFTEGQVWERQRRILAPAFAPARVMGYSGLMAAASDASINKYLPGKSGDSALINVNQWATRVTMDVILQALFRHRGSAEEADTLSEAFRSLARQLVRELLSPISPVRALPYPGRSAKLKNKAIISNFVWSQIKIHREDVASSSDTGPDILDLMLAAHDNHIQSTDAYLTDQEIHDNCVALFVAGHDTSATVLMWWIGFMAKHPDIAERVRGELRRSQPDKAPGPNEVAGLPFLNATIKEAMRMCPPITSLFGRVALRDVKAGGQEIRKGTSVVVPVWHLHHDERWFPDPDEFRPERFMPDAPKIPRGAFMPFGVGPHFCLGQSFATLELALIAAKVLDRFDLSFDEGVTLPEPEVDLVLKTKDPLHVRFMRRER